MKKFVDVIVPLPIANQYTYSLPQEMEEMVQIGCRVIVPFGKKKLLYGNSGKCTLCGPGRGMKRRI